MAKPIDVEWEKARLHLLRTIAEMSSSPPAAPWEAKAVLDLAEAYAWLTSAAQPHGRPHA